jgi:hypothetical protein
MRECIVSVLNWMLTGMPRDIMLGRPPEGQDAFIYVFRLAIPDGCVQFANTLTKFQERE